ncbi:MAG: ABC transporter ATP-binding protein [Halanaerobium sp.]|nr:ABC transporter ATP-binding protein [Halanaerobium sp.]
MEDIVVRVDGFVKKYGDVVAVDGVDFTVRRGEIFGLLGPNGAGKTSTMESLEGLRMPDGGKLQVMGLDPVKEQRKLYQTIGVQLQTSGLPESITVEEAMRFFCAYHGVDPRYDLIERLGLGEKAKAQYYQLSTGQKRHLALALAVAHEPAVLFLDEPTAGLDVASRQELHNLMRELRGKGTTIILSTHDMAEAEAMADRVAILLRGKIVTIGTPREITSKGAGLTRISVRTKESCLQETDKVFPAIQQHLVKDDYIYYYSMDIGSTLLALINHIDEHGDQIIDLRVERPSLEERFLEITGTEVVQ